MKIIQTDLPGVIVIEPRVFGDRRGVFLETYRQDVLKDAGVDVVVAGSYVFNHSSKKEAIESLKI